MHCFCYSVQIQENTSSNIIAQETLLPNLIESNFTNQSLFTTKIGYGFKFDDNLGIITPSCSLKFVTMEINKFEIGSQITLKNSTYSLIGSQDLETKETDHKIKFTGSIEW